MKLLKKVIILIILQDQLINDPFPLGKLREEWGKQYYKSIEDDLPN